MIELTDEQNKEIHDAIEEKLIKRWSSHALVSDMDYMFGAVTAMSIVTGADKDNEIWSHGAGWTMLALGQRSIVAFILERQGRAEMSKQAEAQDELFVRWYHKRDELVSFVRLVYEKLGPGVYTQGERRVVREHAEQLLIDLDMWPPEEMED